MPKLKISTTVTAFALMFWAFTIPNTAQAVDITPPTTTYTQTPSSPDGNNGWYVSVVQFDLESTDLESGVSSINYRIDGGNWQAIEFTNTLNLAPNPSLETVGATSSGSASWEATVVDSEATYANDAGAYAPGYSSKSQRIVATGGTWHGINNQAVFAVATPFENMTASAWVKTTNLTDQAFFTMYAIAPDPLGGPDIVQAIGTSPVVAGTTEWTQISLNYNVTLLGATGVFMDIGLVGAGTLWVDAITINSSTSIAQTSFTVGSDSENHIVEWYAVDAAGNAELYNCGTATNCVTFKSDSTPPGNWHDSGAFRGFFGANHELYVYTNVQDATSGLSVFSDKYQYKVDAQDTFGKYPSILSCNGTWNTGGWVILITPPFSPGAKDAFLLTPKTDFCNSNWKQCKAVRFYSIDMAGNSATKDLCINGPWLQFSGEASVRSNENITMVSEPPDDNTDGLIEAAGTNIDFFTTSRNWKVRNSPILSGHDYDYFFNRAGTKTDITGGDLVSSDGVYIYNGNFTAQNSTVPNDYDNASFDQVVFIDGDLTITNNIEVDADSTALFVVSGNVNIEKNVDRVGIAIYADGDFDTASDIAEGESAGTLEFRGMYSGNKYTFKRTLQGTNNEDFPSEDFIYEPKYLVQLREAFGETAIRWKSVK